MKSLRIVQLISALGLLGAVLSPATGIAQSPPPGSVDSFSGSFGADVPITVPGFRSLTPEIGLSYDSSNGNGWAGVGWAVRGVSEILLRSPGNGIPLYPYTYFDPSTSTDVFYLDGMELIPCTDHGGDYCTKIDNYSRISFDNDVWTVTATNGHVATYEPLSSVTIGFVGHTTPTYVYRWALTSLTDTSGEPGNRVDYQYDCEPSPQEAECYLHSISYNGTEVRFYRENVERPDPLYTANGAGWLANRFRLKTIAVRVSGAIARAYEVSYVQSPDSNRSLLHSITEYGNDAVIDELTGAVTTGSKLPRSTFQYGSGAGAGAPGGSFDHQVSHWGGDAEGAVVIGDFDGNGKSDFAAFTSENTSSDSDVVFYLSDGASLTPVAEQAVNNGDDCLGSWRAADLNGDGLSDLVCIEIRDNDLKISSAISNGGGSITAVQQVLNPAEDPDESEDQWLTGDMNSDGMTDLIWIHRIGGPPGVTWVGRLLSNGDGTFSLFFDTISTPWIEDSLWFTADLNGDGHLDLVRAYEAGGDVAFTTHTRRAAVGWDYGSQGTNWSWKNDPADWRWSVADVNGDGNDDIMIVRKTSSGNARVDVAISAHTWGYNLDRFDLFQYSTGVPYAYSGGAGLSERISFGDINGDGMTDVAMLGGSWEFYPQDDPLLVTDYTFLSDGDGTFSQVTGSAWNTHQRYVADANGDGVADFMTFDHRSPLVSAGPYQYAVYLSERRLDLLETVENGIGGSIHVGYAPSHVWPDASVPAGLNLPTVTRVITDPGSIEGFGGVETIDYEYRLAKWSYSERRFLGFGEVRRQKLGQSSYTVTQFHQHEGCITKPEDAWFYDGAGGLYNSTHYVYDHGASPTEPPFVSFLRERWDYECNGETDTVNCLGTMREYDVDSYGNIWKEIEDPDITVGGDERTTYREYQPNLSDYIVGLPSLERLYEGAGIAGAVVQESYFEYDDGAYPAPPVRGYTTGVNHFNSVTNSYESTAFEYDQYGNRKASVGATGIRNDWTYDNTYNIYVKSRCNALGHCTNEQYDPRTGKPEWLDDVNGQRTEFHYDPFGREAAIETPDGEVSTIEYDFFGILGFQHVRFTDPTGLITQKKFDGLGRIVARVEQYPGGDSKQVITRYSDASDRPWKESLPYFQSDETPGPVGPPYYTEYIYDDAGRLQLVRAPDLSEVETVYGVGTTSLIRDIDRANGLEQELVFWHDGFGRQTQIRERVDGAYQYTSFDYDLADNRTLVTDHDGSVSIHGYVSLGRVVSSCDPSRGCWANTYYPDGRLHTQTNAEGNIITFSYDSIGRVKTRSSQMTAQEPPELDVTWAYDGLYQGYSSGRLTSVLYPGGSKVLRYDEMGRVDVSYNCVDGVCKTITRGFDSVGRLEFVRYPNGEQVDYGYSLATGELDSVSSNLRSYVESMTWSADDRLETVSHSNGTTSVYEYDPLRRWLDASRTEGPAGELYYESDFEYDDSARIHTYSVEVATPSAPGTTTVEAGTYLYDELSRLKTVTGSSAQALTYGAVGQIATNSRFPDGNFPTNDAYIYGTSQPHCVRRANSRLYTYNANGSLTAEKHIIAESWWGLIATTPKQYQFDAYNRTISATVSGDTTQYQYDEVGERVSSSGVAGTRRYFGSLIEQDESGVDTYYYFAGASRIAMNSGSTTHWYHSDRLGSPRLTTDHTGLPVWSKQYASFGELTATDGPVDQIGYTGHYNAAETGLLYAKARYYDPVLGRFTSADSVIPDIANPQATDRYSYVYNNPISNIDPTGHAPISIDILPHPQIKNTGPRQGSLGTAGIAATWKNGVLGESSSVLEVHLGFKGGYALPSSVSAYGTLGAGDRLSSTRIGAFGTDASAALEAVGRTELPLRPLSRGEPGLQPGDRSIGMQLGEVVRGPDVVRMIDRLGKRIDSAASAYGVDGNLIRGIIYEESTHLLPGEELAEYFGFGSTVGIGQVTEGMFGLTRGQLQTQSIAAFAIGRFLGQIQGQPLIDPSAPYSSAATTYNCGSCTSITSYGRRVNFYRNQFNYYNETSGIVGRR